MRAMAGCALTWERCPGFAFGAGLVRCIGDLAAIDVEEVAISRD